MDELEFRRQLYANPRARDEELLQAANSTAKNKQFYDELQSFESQLDQALKVDVPDGLAERLILTQSFDDTQDRYRKRTRIHLALAASIAFAIGLSINWSGWQSAISPNLGSEALAHVHHESPYLAGVNEQPDLHTVNAKLTRFGVNFSAMPGEVVYVNHCAYNGKPSFHMVMKGKMGSHVNVFVVPESAGLKFVDEFTDGKMHGQATKLKRANLVVVGDLNEPLDAAMQSIESMLNQSI